MHLKIILFTILKISQTEDLVEFYKQRLNQFLVVNGTDKMFLSAGTESVITVSCWSCRFSLPKGFGKFTFIIMVGKEAASTQFLHMTEDKYRNSGYGEKFMIFIFLLSTPSINLGNFNFKDVCDLNDNLNLIFKESNTISTD